MCEHDVVCGVYHTVRSLPVHGAAHTCTHVFTCSAVLVLVLTYVAYGIT
jgi:hypothetical protein